MSLAGLAAPDTFRTCSDGFPVRPGLMTGPAQFPGSGMAPPGAAAPPLDLQNTNGALSSLLPSLLGVQGGTSATNLSQAAQAGTNQLAGLLQSLSGGTPTLGAPALSGGGSLLAGQELASLGGASGRAGRGGGRTSSDTRPATSYNARHQQVSRLLHGSQPRRWPAGAPQEALAAPHAAAESPGMLALLPCPVSNPTLPRAAPHALDTPAAALRPAPPTHRRRRAAACASTSAWRRCGSWCPTPSAPTQPTSWKSWWTMCSACSGASSSWSSSWGWRPACSCRRAPSRSPVRPRTTLPLCLPWGVPAKECVLQVVRHSCATGRQLNAAVRPCLWPKTHAGMLATVTATSPLGLSRLRSLASPSS